MKTKAPFLVDANALIALTWQTHEHHRAAAEWVASVTSFAICPIVEGALVRFMVRIGAHPLTTQELLTSLYASPKCDFWPDSISYQDLELRHVLGHRQVTDAYLVGLAKSHGARLATFDRGLALTAPDAVHLIQ